MNTRDKLLAEAIRLFADEGYERVTVNEVVEAAALTKGAFYHYFDSKEDLLAEIHSSYVDFAFERFERIATEGLTPSETLTAMLRELIEQIHSYRAHVVILWESHRSLSDAAAERIDGKKADIRRLFQRTIERGQRAGEFDQDRDSTLAALGIFGMGMWTYHWYRPGGKASADDVASEFTQLVLNGLAVPERAEANPVPATS